MIAIGAARLLNRHEVAEVLGIAPRTLSWRVKNGHFPEGKRIGNMPHWFEEDVEKFLRDL